MAATYPGAIKSYQAKTNFTEIVDSSHVNSLQDEVVAIQTNLGTNIATSTSPSSSGTFNVASQNYGTLNARLANIEIGIVADSHNQYVHKTGGDTLTPSAIGVVGLNIRAAVGQTANLQEWRNSSNTLRTWIDQNGNLNTTSGVAATSSDIADLTGLVIAGVF
jgi:hypothetical protein